MFRLLISAIICLGANQATHSQFTKPEQIPAPYQTPVSLPVPPPPGKAFANQRQLKFAKSSGLSIPAATDCGGTGIWETKFASLAGTNGTVYALAVLNGTLYVAGDFTSVNGIAANNIAAWDGRTWQALGAANDARGNGTDGPIYALTASGDSLFVGGTFHSAFNRASATANPAANAQIVANNLARWNGTQWSAVGDSREAGVNGGVFALVARGNSLFVGGDFTQVTAQQTRTPANQIAQWTGTEWVTLGKGVNGTVYAITFFGDELIVGGAFDAASQTNNDVIATGGVAVRRQNQWHALGNGVAGTVLALATNQQGIFIGGQFERVYQANGNALNTSNLAFWANNTWQTLGGGLAGRVYSLNWQGDELFVGGAFQANHAAAQSPASSLVNRVAKWSANRWSTIASGLNETVYALHFFSNDLYAGGEFTSTTDNNPATQLSHLARLQSNRWVPLTAPSTINQLDLNGPVFAIMTYGADIIVGGNFTRAGTVNARNLARWNGSSWSALGLGLNGPVRALTVHQGRLVVGGEFTVAHQTESSSTLVNHLASWNGNNWSAIGIGVNGHVYALTNLQNELIVGGSFSHAWQPDGSPLNVNCLAKWAGNGWQAIGKGLNAPVLALATRGSELFVGGRFVTTWQSTGTAIRVNHFARWSENSWTSFAGGFDNEVRAIAITNNALYVGGKFTAAFDTANTTARPLQSIARWNGESWGSLTNQIEQSDHGVGNYFSSVNALTVNGEELFMAGYFQSALSSQAALNANHVARWSNNRWHTFQPGIRSRAFLQAVHATHYHQGSLYLGGEFTHANNVPSPYLAQLNFNTAATVISLSSNQTTASYGQALTLTARVTNASAGNVTFRVGQLLLGSKDIINGQASVVTDALPGGAQTISATFTPANGDTCNTVSTTLNVTITKVTLLVRANDIIRFYGDSNPTLTHTITGFVRNESVNVLNGSPQLSTIANPNSLPGTYPISAATGSLQSPNYLFQFSNGTLTIKATAPLITSNGLQLIQGSTAQTLTIANASDRLTPTSQLKISATELPAGLTLTNLNNQQGTLTAQISPACNLPAGLHAFALTATNNAGLTTAQRINVTIRPNSPPGFAYPTELAMPIGSSRSIAPLASPIDNGSIQSAQVTSNSSTFAGKLTLNASTGELAITNAQPQGTHNITVTMIDNCGASASSSFVLSITALCSSLALAPAGLPPATAGLPFAQTFSISGSGEAATYQVESGTLPNGLTLSPNGVLSGTPLVAGTNNFVIAARTSNGCSTSKSYALTIQPPQVTLVSAATYRAEGFAAEMMVTAFGSQLATTTAVASAVPLPSNLAGTSVRIIDTQGKDYFAGLLFVSPRQLNFVLPPGLASGVAQVIFTNSFGTTARSAINITRVAPGLFTADASGRGFPAATLLRVKSNGVQSYEPIVRYDQAMQQFVPVPLDFGAMNDNLYLVLFGTGWRYRTALSNVTVTIGGTNATIFYAGAQGTAAGQDQINLQVPSSLRGRGRLDLQLTVEGQTANTVQIQIK